MKTIGIALGSILSIILVLLGLLLINIDVGDIVYSILGAAFVSIFASLVAMNKNIPAWRISIIVLASILFAVVAWILASITLQIMTVSLYSITALAFDLITGIISGIAISSVLIEKYDNRLSV